MKKQNNITRIITMVLAVGFLPTVGHSNEPEFGFTGDSRGAEFMRERYPAELLDELVAECGGEPEVWKEYFRLRDTSMAIMGMGVVVFVPSFLTLLNTSTAATVNLAGSSSLASVVTAAGGFLGAAFYKPLSSSQLECAEESDVW